MVRMNTDEKLIVKNKEIKKMIRGIIATFGSMALLAAVFLIIEERAKLDGSRIGVEYFLYDMMKIPTSILVIGTIVLGFVINYIRIGQTEKSLDELVNQNTARNYFDHKKNFVKIIKEIAIDYKVILNADDVYKHFYPDNTFTKMTFDYDQKVDDFFNTLSNTEDVRKKEGMPNALPMFCQLVSSNTFDFSIKTVIKNKTYDAWMPKDTYDVSLNLLIDIYNAVLGYHNKNTKYTNFKPSNVDDYLNEYQENWLEYLN